MANACMSEKSKICLYSEVDTLKKSASEDSDHSS